jgi:hypothetical protein
MHSVDYFYYHSCLLTNFFFFNFGDHDAYDKGNVMGLKCVFVSTSVQNIFCSDKHLASYCPVTHGNARRFLCSACRYCPSRTKTGAADGY